MSNLLDLDFVELVGKTLTNIETIDNDQTMYFHCLDGTIYQLHYYQDCCAHCSVEDICGELDDILGSPILLAEEVSNTKPTDEIIEKRRIEYEKEKNNFSYDSFEEYCSCRFASETWTFYKLATVKGAVTIRWYGSSNGYYSEKATFERLAL